MDQVEHLIPSDKLKTNLLATRKDKHGPLFVDYDPEFDALFVRIVPRDTEVVAHYLDEYVALLYVADSLEIVGIQVEDFK